MKKRLGPNQSEDRFFSQGRFSWFQWYLDLGTVFAFLSVVSIGQAGEKDVIERLEKAGVQVLHVERFGEKDCLEVSFRDMKGKAPLSELCELRHLRSLWVKTDVTDAEMGTIGQLTGLKALYLYESNVTDAGLKELRTLRNLEYLSLDKTNVTDAGLKELRTLRNLEYLSLDKTNITDAGLKRLAPLESLTGIRMVDTKVTDNGLDRLADLPALEFLNLEDCPGITDAGIRSLAHMKKLKTLVLRGTSVKSGLKELRLRNLEYLSLSRTGVSSAGLKGLTGLESLKTFCLDNTDVTDDGLNELTGLSALTILDLTNCAGITDAGIDTIARMKNLRQISLSRTRVTEAGVTRLKKALPECNVFTKP